MSSDDDFVHLHTHTEYSNFDGCGKMTDFMKAAKERGQPAIAFTEHGTVRHITKLQEESEEIGIKPIYAVELYMCEDMDRKGLTDDEKDEVTKGVPAGKRREAIYQAERRMGIRARYHLTVIAKNNEGLRNLMRVTSLGWIKGWYTRPRVNMETLLKHHEGLIVLSGCQIGAIGADYLGEGPSGKPDPSAAADKAALLHETFGEDFYAEIMPHNMEEQVTVNKAVRSMSRMWNIPLVATQDAHYIDPGDWKYQEAMLCINTRSDLRDPNRFRFSVTDFWLKTRREMEDSFRKRHGYLSDSDVKKALDNTLEITEKCTANIEVDRFKALVPPVPVPSEFNGDEFAYIRSLCMDGWVARRVDDKIREVAALKRVSFTEMRKRYWDRLQLELTAIKRQKCVRYFLLVWDLYKWVRSVGIEVGPGRGSVGGSIVAFLLFITDIDPIRFGLLFERFLSPARIDMPDVDMDFEDQRREEVIQHLREKYGHDCTAQIAANGKLTGKQCLKDIARVMGIPLGEVQPVVDSIIQRSSGDERASMTIEDSFTEFPVCRQFAAKYPQVLEYAQKLEGQVKSLGLHAAGVVVAPEPLINLVPLEIRQERSANPIIATAVDMYGVANLGLMKLDVLGIRNLTAMKRCLRAIEERHNIHVDWLELPLDDQPTLDNFTNHSYTGIFQYDTTSADKICEGVQFEHFEDVVAMVALNRPGTARSGLATEYLKRKKDPKAIKSIHPVVDEICKDTLGVIVYQEHVMRIFTDVAGFNPATADSLRRKIAKKYGDEAIAKERTAFVEGAVKRGFDKALAEKLISQITFFGSYGFNKSHSVAYGLIAYRQMWLKTHYPIEFMWALLDTEPNNDEVVRLVRATRRMGIDVRPPDINGSEPGRWTLVDDYITGALSNIKGVGPSATLAITAARPFKSLSDLAERIDRRKCHKGVIEAMIKAGAMSSLIPNPKWILTTPEGEKKSNLERLWHTINKKDWQAKMEAELLASAEEEQWDEEEAQQIAALINPLASGVDPLEPYQEMVDQMRDNWLAMDAEDFWDHKDGWVWGRILEVRYNQIGDFHSGVEPSDEKKRRMGWGKRYANINVEDRSGRNQRVKVDTDNFEAFRHIIDKGTDTVIAAHVSIGKQYHSVRASFVVDLEVLRNKLREDHDLTILEMALYRGWRPGGAPSKPVVNKRSVRVKAMITRVMKKIDKNNNEMAFMGLLCGDGKHREALCFASSWPAFSGRVKQGRCAEFHLSRGDRKSLILDHEITDAMEDL